MDVNDKYKKFKELYRNKPALYFQNVLGLRLSVQQQKVLASMNRKATRTAVKSATGTGKTFLCAGYILHQLHCEDDIKMLGTAPSSGQLKRGLKAEVRKLHRKIIPALRDLITIQSEQAVVTGLEENFCSFVSADTDNQESLAGLHAKKVVVINDEASALTDKANDTLMGNLTTPGSGMINISNPVRPDGKFRDLFRNKELQKIWSLHTLDAFGSPFISPSWIKEIEATYGLDSDMYKTRVLGNFPSLSEDLFFLSDSIESAIDRVISPNVYGTHRRRMGLDVARFGKDKTVFSMRQGPSVTDVTCHEKLNTEEVAALAVSYANQHGAQDIYVDGIGVGAGVVDKLKVLSKSGALKARVHDVVVSQASTDPRTYYKMRSQLHGALKLWIENGASLPDVKGLKEQFESVRYGFNEKMQIQILSKKDLKHRYKVDSPDIVDSIMLTLYDECSGYTEPLSVIHSQKRIITPSQFVY